MLVLAVLTANAFLSAFGGSWACTPHLPGSAPAPVSTWTIAQVPHSSWVSVHWSTRPGNAGTAFVGYLPAEQQWIYEDFHGDGSFATNTSSGPQDGVWTWSGSYATQQRVVHGAVSWKRDKTGFRQGFGRLLGVSFRETAYADCRRLKR